MVQAAMSTPIRILIADDHPLIREGLLALLAGYPDIELVGEAADGKEAVDLFMRLQPDLLVLDLQMPVLSGLDAMAAILARDPDARIIVLTTYDTQQVVAQALGAGARAYLLKTAVRVDLVNTIRTVHATGRRIIDAGVVETLQANSLNNTLTRRETDVLKLIACGNTNREIGLALHLTEETVKSYVKSLLSKLSANDRAHAVAIGIKRGLIET